MCNSFDLWLIQRLIKMFKISLSVVTHMAKIVNTCFFSKSEDSKQNFGKHAMVFKDVYSISYSMNGLF